MDLRVQGMLPTVVVYLAPLAAQLVKNPPVMWETWVQSLGWEDPLEKGTATHSSILATRISWTEEPGGLQSMGLHNCAPEQVKRAKVNML